MLSALGELLIVGGFILLAMSSATFPIAIVGWLIANAVLGIRLSLTGGRWRTWGPTLAGLAIACLLSGVGAAGAAVVGMFPKQADTNAPPSMLVAGLLVAMVVFIFGAPLVTGGLVGGTLIGDTATEVGHVLVATGRRSLRRPSKALEVRTRSSRPLDELGVAKATADGAATTVIIEYAANADPNAALAADSKRLAAIGYTLTSTTPRPTKRGLGWPLLSLGLFLFGGRGQRVFEREIDEETRARVVATFRLRSTTHARAATSLPQAGSVGSSVESSDSHNEPPLEP